MSCLKPLQHARYNAYVDIKTIIVGSYTSYSVLSKDGLDQIILCNKHKNNGSIKLL